jgi:hypothetical protein
MNPGFHSHSMPNSPLHASPYASNEERAKHLHVIARLATEVSRSADEIGPLYEDILAHMKDTARVQDYLPILVSRRVKEVLAQS